MSEVLTAISDCPRPQSSPPPCFCTLLWGLVDLILATPLTVFLRALGKHGSSVRRRACTRAPRRVLPARARRRCRSGYQGGRAEAKDLRLLQISTTTSQSRCSRWLRRRGQRPARSRYFPLRARARMRRFRAYSRSVVYQIGECKSLETRKIAHAVCRRFDDAKRNHEASVIARRPGTCPVLLILDV